MMTDRDGPRSNPYHLNPAKACEKCVFGSGLHSAWCVAGIREGLHYYFPKGVPFDPPLPDFLGREVDHMPANTPVVRIPLDMLRNRFDSNLSTDPLSGDTKA